MALTNDAVVAHLQVQRALGCRQAHPHLVRAGMLGHVVEQLLHAAIVAEDVPYEIVELFAKRRDQVIGVIGKQVGIGIDQFQATHIEPLPGEIVHQRL